MLPYCTSLQYFQVNNSMLLKYAHIKFTLGQMLRDCETYCLLYMQCLVPVSIMKCKSTEFYTNTKFNFSKFSDLSEVNWITAASLSLQYSALEYDNPMDSYHCYLIVGQFWKWTWKTNIWELQIHAQSEINWTKAFEWGMLFEISFLSFCLLWQLKVTYLCRFISSKECFQITQLGKQLKVTYLCK